MIDLANPHVCPSQSLISVAIEPAPHHNSVAARKAKAKYQRFT